MIEKILDLKGIAVLSKEEQKSVNGGFRTWCAKRHGNIVDLRKGGQEVEVGWQNEYGCWIYS
ncbi:hypothetical protein BC748_2935 [Flavobacterium dankookense]|uniref:Uncharacterized protein n=2 Tax=Flavobacterium dankookense TaxID=706186 RepID=A0A4R6Q5V7_9FLAO|nr:hypothetical protein BC748_2935 [Flavobacterium dankookense]